MIEFNIFINGQEYKAKEGDKVLEVAKKFDIYIPALCYHCDLIPHESCRLCMVEVEGDKNLRASCSLLVKPGMRVHTNTPLIEQTLKINLELIFAQHEGKCETCKRKTNCKLLELVQEKHFVASGKYSNRKSNHPKYQFGPSISFDPSKCINCENCSEICAMQTNGGYLRPREGKYNFEVSPSLAHDHDCIYCGQCIAHCPVGALSEAEDYPKVQKLLKNNNKKVVFQFAPAIRTSIGEEFGMAPGEVVTRKIFSALKKLGAYKVFDTSFAADVTIMEESEELIQKVLNGDNEVMFSSCCPAWVKYVEFYEPSFIKNLTSVRSPQIILGGLIKNYWAKKERIKPKDIVVVSIMPCTAKKFEITRRELKIDGINPVDFIITTREFAKLLKESDINLKEIENIESDMEIMGTFTGAGEIFGASGGVLEAAIRTTYSKLTGKSLENLEFKQIHEFRGIKELELSINGKKLSFAAVSGIENVKEILRRIKDNPTRYNCVEVMACPGGCISGGGQPLPTDNEIRKARSNGLYQADRDNKHRESHKNPDIIKLYDEFLCKKEIRHKICHTSFKKRNKGKLSVLK